MRCQKARSFLSAYCNEELTGRKAQSVSEHLATCSDCHREEAFYRSLSDAGNSLAGLKVSGDFNARLLNRVAQERFAETRTKAYLPQRAPSVSWAKLLPATVAACMIALVGVVSFQSLPFGADKQAVAVASGQDDSYLTVQPTSNPNLAAKLNKGWSLTDQLARAERISRISSSLSGAESFGGSSGIHSVNAVSRSGSGRIPFADYVLHIRPVIKVYVAPDQSNTKEAERIY
ncbi:MAG: zf-HC2 domain-containing protein [bacterium]|nr:zf-HC2 domain-containing protein [bacterium]